MEAAKKAKQSETMGVLALPLDPHVILRSKPSLAELTDGDGDRDKNKQINGNKEIHFFCRT